MYLMLIVLASSFSLNVVESQGNHTFVLHRPRNPPVPHHMVPNHQSEPPRATNESQNNTSANEP